MKRRLVRRQPVPSFVYDMVLQLPPLEHGEERCELCLDEFKKTYTMPTVVLPGCKHVLHQACVQHIADAGDPCPICLQEVNWGALSRQTGARSSAKKRKSPKR